VLRKILVGRSRDDDDTTESDAVPHELEWLLSRVHFFTRCAVLEVSAEALLDFQLHLGGPKRVESLGGWPRVRHGVCETFPEFRRSGRNQGRAGINCGTRRWSRGGCERAGMEGRRGGRNEAGFEDGGRNVTREIGGNIGSGTWCTGTESRGGMGDRGRGSIAANGGVGTDERISIDRSMVFMN
jgi:hypothetical protein